MNSLEIAEFKQAIKNFAAKSELPAEVKRMVFGEILRDTEEEARQALIAEIAERNAAEREKNAESV